MSHKQHKRLERERESKQEKEQSFSQLLNKKKSEQSAIASPCVKQKLKQVILHRLDRAALLRKPKQDLNQSERISNSFYSDCFVEDNPLRRTVSEPILKVRSKRSLTCRQNPLQRKTSAPPAVREPDIMGVVSSSASRMNKAADMKTQNYGPAQSQEISNLRGHQAELPQIVIQNSIPLPVASQNWTAVHLHSQVLPVSPHYLAVPVLYPVMSHRALFKTQSAPSYIQHTHIHTQTVEFTHPIHDQHPTCPQEEIQQHTLSNKVPFCVGPMSQGEQNDEERAEKKRLMEWNESYRERDLFGSSDNSCTNRPIRRPQRRNNKSLPSRLSSQLSQSIRNKLNYTTGLVYDSLMLKHECDCGDNSNHPEHAGRIRSIWSRLHECGLRSQCELVIGRMATFKELQSVHLKQHVIQFTELSETPNRMGAFKTLPCGGSGRHYDMVWNSVFSTSALKMAVGSVIELALRVAYGELRNGFAVVRPPGHHASQSQANGFSIFNSVAIAAKQLQDRLNMKKILIVDWDIHHGCGTEKIFYTDPSVLYISLHRYDDGSFFPGTGEPNMVGEGNGKGYNVNVAWSGGLNPPMGDAEYLAAFRTVVMPIAHEFSPNVVLVSAGFDATEGHSAALGGYKVSAKCFGVLTRKLLELAEGRVVLVLEGGYDLTTLCDASQACVNSLIGNEPEPLAEEELLRRPCDNAIRSLEELLRVQSRYWHSVRSMLDTVALPHVKAERRYSAGSDAASALGALTMTVPSRRCFPNEPTEHDEADSI